MSVSEEQLVGLEQNGGLEGEEREVKKGKSSLTWCPWFPPLPRTTDGNKINRKKGKTTVNWSC